MKKEITGNFARNFCDLMVDQGRTYDDLEAIVGISKGTLCKYARDKQKPSAENVARIAQFFGVSMDELVGVTLHESEDKTKYLPKAASETLDALFEDELFNYWAVLLCDPNFLKLIKQLKSYLMAALTEDMEKIPELKSSKPMPADIIIDWVNKEMYGGDPLSDVWKYRCTETFRALLSGTADFEKKCVERITEVAKEANASA